MSEKRQAIQETLSFVVERNPLYTRYSSQTCPNAQAFKKTVLYKETYSKCYGKAKLTNQFVFWLLNKFFQLLYSSQSSVSVVFPSNPPKKI